ncbi:MAG: ATP-binding protein [Planctomycetota bacterium]
MDNARYKMLLIEDNKVDQMAFRQFVENKGLPYDCTITGSIAEAQSLLASAQFDVIITDYSLGDGTALDILDSITDIPTIFITGSGNEEVAVRAWKGGACGYLAKDMERDYLNAVPRAVEAAIRNRETAENVRYRVLLVEDNKLDQMAFTRYIDDKKLLYEYTIAGSFSQARSILDSEKFDIVVSDYSLGDGTALDVLDLVKDVPVIVVTGAGDEEVAINAWKAGAYDYLTKDLERTYLKAIPKTIGNAIKHKRMEEALDRKQKNLEAIFDAAPVGMLLADENMIITRVNDTIRQIFHRDYPQIIDQQIGGAIGCIHSTDNEKRCGCDSICSECLLRQTIKNVLDSGKSAHNVETHPRLRIDGKETALWLRLSAEPVSIDGRRHIVIAVDDITEHKEAEQKLQLVEDRYRVIFENSAVAIMMADEQERLVSWNGFTETLLDRTREDLYLKPVQSLYPQKEWERIRACNIRQKGMQHHLETKMIKRDGSEIDVDISLRVLKNSDGEAMGSIGVIRHIAERKTAELKQARLLKEVETINHELNDFASIVSHDLKAPLRGIKTLAGWISTDYGDKLGHEGTEQINLLSSRVDRMYALIEGVLEYSKIGRVKEERVQLNLNDLVPNVIDMIAPPENITITIENELPVVDCEQTRITQVFQNLLSNAIKYINKPQGLVRVGCTADGDFWKFSVADNGPGIKEKHFEKIFQIFQTLSSSDEFESTGVGLTIIKKIVELYGGRIWVESEFGEGSTFFFTLPRQETAVKEVTAVLTCV